MREFQCSSFKEFLAWKEEEETNNVFYAQTTGRKVLHDTTNIDELGTTNYSIIKLLFIEFAFIEYRYYYSCCRDGKSRQNKWTKRKTDKKRGEGGKKPSRKLNDVCISRIYATVRGRNGAVNVMYIPAHTNHTLSIKEEAKHLPLPISTRNEIAAKLQCGISVKRVMEGT